MSDLTMPKSETTLGEIHADMARYLAEDCYCPGEIYDITGFFCQIYKPETTCIVIATNGERTAVVAKPWNFKKGGYSEEDKLQALIFWHDDDEKPGRIIGAQRVDATENNIEVLRKVVDGDKPDGTKLDEFEEGSTAESLREIMEICDLVLVD